MDMEKMLNNMYFHNLVALTAIFICVRIQLLQQLVTEILPSAPPSMEAHAKEQS